MKALICFVIFLGFSVNSLALDDDGGLVSISESIVDQLSSQNKNSIVIIDFSSPNGDVSELGRSLSNKLRINIAKLGRGITIVNRAILKQSLAEEQLFKDGIINPDTAKKISFIGVDVVVIGEISDYGNNYSIEMQLIDTERSNIVGGEVLDIPKTESLRKLNENILINTNTNLTKSTSNTGSIEKYSESDRPANFPIEKNLGGIKVRVDGIEFSDSRIVIYFRVFNGLDVPATIGLYSGNNKNNQTKINIDGDIYPSASIKIANKSCSLNCYKDENISSRSWVKGIVTFENMPLAKKLSLVQISFYYKDNGWKYQKLILRDVQIDV